MPSTQNTLGLCVADCFGSKLFFAFTTVQYPNSEHEQALKLASVNPEKWVRLKQTHGDGIHVVDSNNVGLVPEADAVITNQTDLTLSIKTADCLPVALYDHTHAAFV